MDRARRISGRRAAATALLVAACAFALAACGGGSDDGGEAAAAETSEAATAPAEAAAPELTTLNDGQLTVGMNLQFKPQMFLDNGEPAGYDVELLKALAADLGLELNIKNLDFNGLIPGLQANQFDMVSVGLSNTPERDEVIDFTRGYVPYVQVLAVPDGEPSPTAPEELNTAGTVITALQGSTAEQLAQTLFPEAEVKGFPDQNAAFLEVATGRADGIVVENYLLAEFQKSNPDELQEAAFEAPLDVQYGSWAVPEGNTDWVTFLDGWLCEAQTNGTLEQSYTQAFGVDKLPPMPEC